MENNIQLTIDRNAQNVGEEYNKQDIYGGWTKNFWRKETNLNILRKNGQCCQEIFVYGNLGRWNWLERNLWKEIVLVVNDSKAGKKYLWIINEPIAEY